MDNFYNEFDKETLGSRKKENFRSVFQVDRDRILYSEAFRRLQNKTQVFSSGEYDFYRTRLTHSLEVSQIGQSITNYLNQNFFKEKAIDSDLVEGICLAHDMGNPPFGHPGEAVLNALMQEAGGFEGNAQTLKIITEQIQDTHDDMSGMKPSRAFLDGIIKYKKLRSENPNSKKFLYDNQKKYLGFISPDKTIYPERSLECQIMNWSDDVAYGLHDLIDGYLADFINQRNIFKWAANNKLDRDEQHYIDIIIKNLDYRADFERFIAKKTGVCIENVDLKTTNHPLAKTTNRYKYCLQIDDQIEKEINLYKRISTDIIFHSPQLEQLEFKETYILKQLFNVFILQDENGFKVDTRILPDKLRIKIDQAKRGNFETNARIICDYLSEQTDPSLIRMYKRLFDPDFGSFSDILK
ncbi:MAG: dNTP triphosphohydrolase [Candidatus Marinimicrobia bacterium]|nr:dNTP triphosphohydrolase [Candidatus Neomarinimicrobiota bacterium]